MYLNYLAHGYQGLHVKKAKQNKTTCKYNSDDFLDIYKN